MCSTRGTFLSPDTLVPDAGVLFDYNRFAYARLNPLKYTDPTGHYTNDEIMQHFGCSDWACVEGFFQDGKAYAGLWGWLYILQKANNGDRVFSHFGWTGGIGGTFQFSNNFVFEILADDGNVLHPAHFAFNAREKRFGSYTLNPGYSSSRAAFTFAGTKHQMRILPSEIDKPGVGLGLVKAGTEFGPQLAKSGNPYLAAAGMTWTIAGGAAMIYTDIINPIYEGVKGNPDPTVELAVDALIEYTAEKSIPGAKPYVGPAIDTARAIWPALCWGTHCYGQ